jgi:phosphatidylserine decarboxylase
MMTLAALITAVFLFVTLSLAGRKWELPLRYYLPWSGLMALVGALLVTAAHRTWPNVPTLLWCVPGIGLPGAATIATIAGFFFRDPERTPPPGANQVVSPADGRIVYIKKIENGQFPFAVKGRNTIPLREFSTVDLIPCDGWQIGIAMNFLDVHVNRSPIAGKVTMREAIPGKFASLKQIGSLLENERMLLVIQGAELTVGLVQIASRLVRRIVPYVEVGERVAQGQRVGMIRFGSQVDVLVANPECLQLQIEVGDVVVAGETLLMTYDPGKAPKTAAGHLTMAAAGAGE